MVDLEQAQAFFRASPFMVDLGVEAVEVGPGRMHTQLVIANKHLQHTGQVHAGVLATLADHTMGAAAQTLVTDGRWIVTAELKTSVMRPARGRLLACNAQVLKIGRQLAFTEAEVWAEDEAGARTLAVKASATMALATMKG